MGATSSIISTPPASREEIYKRTDEYRTLLNDIFNYMMHEIKINDFMQLSTDAGCKKYVLFMANNLQHFFHQMRIDVTRDKHGILAFRRISDVENPTGEAKAQKQTLCTVLAYYYTRIFQIYGAIVLTTVDDMTNIMKSDIPQRIETDITYTINPAPGHQLEQVKGTKRVIQGGAYPDLGILRFIHPFLSTVPGKEEYVRDKRDSYGYVTQYQGLGRDDIVFFKPDMEQTDAVGRRLVINPRKRTALFSIYLPALPKISYLEMELEEERNMEVSFALRSLKYTKKGESYETTEYIMRGKPILQEIFEDNNLPYQFTLLPSTNRDIPYQIKDSTLDVAGYFQKMLGVLIPYIKKKAEDKSAYAVSISNSAVQKPLQLGSTVDAITRNPQAVCISRAEQLLRRDAFGRDPAEQKFVSSICKNTFFQAGDKKPERKGIPLPGHPLSESKALQATVLLFFDTISSATPGVFQGSNITMSDASFQQYRAFMLKLTALYEGTAAMQQKTITPKTTLDDIKDIHGTAQGICHDYKDQEISLTLEQAKQIQPYVLSLLERQMKHIRECNAILNELFYVKRTSPREVSISLSQGIMRGGIPFLNQMVVKTRNVLTSYFIDCDVMYVHAEDKVLEVKHEEKVKAAKAAADARKVAEQAALARAAARAAQNTRIPTTQTQGPIPMGLATAPLAQAAAEEGERRRKMGEATRAAAAAQLAAQQAQETALAAQRAATNTAAQQAALQQAELQRKEQELRNRLAGMPRSNQVTVAEGEQYGTQLERSQRVRRPPVRFGQGGGKTRKRRAI